MSVNELKPLAEEGDKLSDYVKQFIDDKLLKRQNWKWSVQRLVDEEIETVIKEGVQKYIKEHRDEIVEEALRLAKLKGVKSLIQKSIKSHVREQIHFVVNNHIFYDESINKLIREYLRERLLLT